MAGRVMPAFLNPRTYSKSNVPLLGALIDYIEISLVYLRTKTFTEAEKLHAKTSKATLSATFLAAVCLLLGMACNVKFEVVTMNEEPLPKDLHLMVISKNDKLYIDDIDASRVMWCLEASDCLVVLISCLLVWNSSNVSSPDFYKIPSSDIEMGLWDHMGTTSFQLQKESGESVHTVASYERSPLSEYLFLPWLGATLRGLFVRQAPTAGALLYTMAVINGNVNPLFLTAFSFLFLLEARLWLEIARLVRSRWEQREYNDGALDSEYEVETLWSNDDVQSIEMRNTVY